MRPGLNATQRFQLSWFSVVLLVADHGFLVEPIRGGGITGSGFVCSKRSRFVTVGTLKNLPQILCFLSSILVHCSVKWACSQAKPLLETLHVPKASGNLIPPPLPGHKITSMRPSCDICVSQACEGADSYRVDQHLVRRIKPEGSQKCHAAVRSVRLRGMS